MMRTDSIRAMGFIMLVLLSGSLRAEQDPEAVFQEYHAALMAGDLDRMLQYAPSDQQQKLSTYTAGQKQQMVRLMTALVPKSYTISSKTVNENGSEATLYGSGMGTSIVDDKPEMQYATVHMIREQGAWKVKQTSWKSTPDSDAPGGAPLQVASADTVSDAPAAPGPEAQPAAPAMPAAAAEPEQAPTAPESAEPPAAPVPQAAPKKKVPPCEIKPVMTDEEIATCRRAADAR